MIDASNPANMHVVGSVGLNDARDLSAAPSYVFVADASSGLVVISVSGPPVIVATLGVLGTPTCVTNANGRVYLGGSDGLWVVNVTDPAHPFVSRHLSGTVQDVASGGDGLLYVSDAAAGLKIYDISVPDAPALTGTLPLSQPGRMFASNHHVLIDDRDGIGYVDASDPASPVLTGSFKGFQFLGASMQGFYAYVAAGWAGIQSLDFYPPTDVPESAFLADGMSGQDLSVASNLLSLVTGAELINFDVTDPLTPARLGSYPLNGGHALSVQDGRAYVLDQDGLKIVDLSDPAHPVLLGSSSNHGARIQVHGARAFLDLYPTIGLDILDISDPGHISTLGTFYPPNMLYGMASSGPNDVYTLGAFEGSSVVDHWNVSDPAHPTLAGEGLVPVPEDGIAFGGGRLVLSGLYLDLVDPIRLTMQSQIGVHRFGSTIAFGSSLIYCWDGSAASIFEPGPTPRYLGSAFCTSPTQTGGIAEVGGYLYMADATGLHVFSPPCGASSSPSPIGTFEAGLAAPFPDPFHDETELRFRLATPSAVDLSVYDLSGRKLRTLIKGARLDAGPQSVLWDGRDDRGRETGAGLYFARLAVHGRLTTRKVVRLP